MKRFLTLLFLLGSMTISAASSMGENHEDCIYNTGKRDIGKTAYEMLLQENLSKYLKAAGQGQKRGTREQ